MKYIKQTPDSLLDYTIDYTDILGDDVIVSSVWECTAPEVQLSNSTLTSKTTTIWITAGTPANIYQILNTATTLAGRIMQETINYDCVANMFI